MLVQLAVAVAALLLGMLLSYLILQRQHARARREQCEVAAETEAELRRLRDEQDEALRTLTEREQQTRLLLDSCPAALIVASVAHRRPIFFNKHVLHMFRMEEAEFRAGGLGGRFVEPGGRDAFFNKLQAQGHVDGEVFEIIRGDGVHMWVQMVAQMGTYNGQVALYGWFADATQRRQEALALQHAKEAAEAATTAKSAFLANMSHEIRTPMNAIIGLTHLALRTELSAQQRDYIHKAHGAGQSLLGIVNDILDFSKIEADRLEFESVDFDLDDTLTHVTTVTSGKACDKELELLFEVPPDVPRWLRGDPLRLGQVLTNLINNAVKFTERGQVLVRCRHALLDDGRIELQVAVHDTGIGMTAEQMSRLFKAFSQADETTTRKFGGTGLGLSISKRLVEMVGGSIGVDSTPGQGSVFRFTWPCEPAGSAHAMGRVLPGNLRGMRVLVVDDNAAAREILGDAVKTFGFDVDMVASGAEAICALQQQADTHPYALVFTDWRMPGMDGLELTRRIKTDMSGRPAPFVVLVTAFGREEIHRQAAQAQADAVLIKPVNQSLLLDTLMALYAREATPQVTDIRSNDELPQLHGLRVLLTEDNEINQQIAVELMRSAAVDVDLADNGQIALDKLEAAPPGRYHIVFMDLQMPVMDGHQAAIAIRANLRYAHLPIIAMTAHAMVEERQRCLAEGMNDHITKPIDPALLYRTLQKWGNQFVQAPPAATQVPPPTAPVAEKPAEPAPDSLRQSLPMLDAVAALRRVAGNRSLYAELLRRYREEQGAFAERTRALLAQGDLATAERAAHTLRGVSGNIGAGAVERRAGALEEALRRRADAAALDALIDAVQAELAPLLSGLDAWLGAQRAVGYVTATADAHATPEAATNALRIDLARLCRLLEQMDGEAEELLQRVRAQAEQQPGGEVLDAVARHVRSFDFDEAALLLRGHPLLQQQEGALGQVAT